MKQFEVSRKSWLLQSPLQNNIKEENMLVKNSEILRTSWLLQSPVQNIPQNTNLAENKQSRMSIKSVFQIDHISTKFKTQKSFRQSNGIEEPDIRNSLFLKYNKKLKHDQNQSIYSGSSHTSKWTDIQNRKKIPKQLKAFMKKKGNQKSKFLQRQSIKSISSISSVKSVNLADKFFDLFKKESKPSCNICLRQLSQNFLFSLSECKHNYCIDCLNYFVEYKVKMFQEITCPDQNCDIIMSQNSQFYKLLSRNIKQKYQKIHRFYTVSKDPTLKLCPKQNCQGIIKLSNNTRRQCNKCHTRFCHKCYFQQHVGECNRHQFLFLKNKLNFKQCSNCKMLVQKNQGCNHIKCRCKHQFCYICGKNWKHDHLCQPQLDQNQQIVQIIHPLLDCIYFEQNFKPKQVTAIKITFKFIMYFLLCLMLLPAFSILVFSYVFLITCAISYALFYHFCLIMNKAYDKILGDFSSVWVSICLLYLLILFAFLFIGVCMIISIVQNISIVSQNFYKKVFKPLFKMCTNFIRMIQII